MAKVRLYFIEEQESAKAAIPSEGYTLFGLLLAADEVHIHRAEDNAALDDVLPVGIDAHQVQAVVQYAADQRADQRAAQLANMVSPCRKHFEHRFV